MTTATTRRRPTRRSLPANYAERFLHRTSRLLDATALQRLRGSRVLIAGCGGVGAAVAVSLARLGVGHFTLADPGRFDEPDVNRQWGADTSTLGQNKALVYRDWLRRIHPDIAVTTETHGVTPATVDQLVAGADLVVDCMDLSVSLELRTRLFALAAAQGAYSITAPVLGFGALVAVAAPDGPSMEPVVELIRQTLTTGKLPRFVHDFYAPSAVAALERDLGTGRVPSLSIGPVLAGGLASMEALVALLSPHPPAFRQPLCLPQVILMDGLKAQHRIASLPELVGQRSCKSTSADRVELLQMTGYNPYLLPAERVAFDLMTDSWAEVPAGDAGTAPATDASAEQRFCELYGFPHALAVTRGRAAEALLATALVRPGTMVVGNALFPTARFHLDSRGANLLDSARDNAADIDLEQLRAALHSETVSCVWLEACCNAVGGAPLSLANLRETHDLCRKAGVPLVLDATRLLENVLLEDATGSDQERLHAFTCLADACVLGATKDFPVRHGGFVAARSASLFGALCDGLLASGTGLADEHKRTLAGFLTADAFGAVRQRVALVAELRRRLETADVPLVGPPGGHAVLVDAAALLPHLSAAQFPVQALAAALFARAGVRTAEHYYSQRQHAAGRQWLRLAVSIERYRMEDLEQVAAALAAIRRQPEQVAGLRKVAQPPGAAGQYLARWELASGGC